LEFKRMGSKSNITSMQVKIQAHCFRIWPPASKVGVCQGALALPAASIANLRSVIRATKPSIEVEAFSATLPGADPSRRRLMGWAQKA
jgi:hypothetical protein